MIMKFKGGELVMKKRILALLMAGVFVLSSLLVGCGSDDKGKNDKNSVSQGDGPWYKAEYHDFTTEKDEYIANVDVYGDAMYFVTQKYVEETGGSITKLKKMMLTDYSITELESLTLEDAYYIMDMFINDTGIYLATQMTEWSSDYSKLLNAEYKIKQCDFEGKEVLSIDITEEMMTKGEEGMPGYLSSLVCDKDGNFVASDDYSFIIAFDKTGAKIADIELTGWGNGLIVSEDGKVYCSYMNEANWEQVFAPVDVAANKLGEDVGSIASYNVYNCYIDANQLVWMTEDNSLSTYNFETEEKRAVLNWLDYNVNGDSIRLMEILENGRILAYTEDYGQEGAVYELVILEESDEPIDEKTVITYATFGTDSDVTGAIVRFNKNSEDYRIKVVDYYDEEDYETAFNAYNEAILSGNVADIISVDATQYKSMARKGLYADLNELMAADADIDREDYFENVLKAYEVDGKLYAMPTSFVVSTLVGSKEVWGDKAQVTLEDMKAVMDAAPADVALMDNMSKSYFMYLMTQGMIENFVNWETGECSFESEEFIDILEMANAFPKEYDYESQTMSTPEKLQSGKVLLYGEAFYEISSYQVVKEFFNTETVALGYPGVGGNGGLISNSNNLFAISNDSENKEAAWEFVKYMISEDYQCNYIYWQNPIHKAAFEKQMEEATKKEYYTDENGNQVESPKMTYGWDDFQVSVYAATEDDIKEYTELLEGATTLSTYEEDIMTMINEEVEPFFDGKKSAQDVAKIIQGRVKIYVNENR